MAERTVHAVYIFRKQKQKIFQHPFDVRALAEKKNENVNKKRLTIAIMMKMSNRLHTYTSWNFCSWCYNVAANTTTTTTYLMYILWGQVYFEMHASCSPSRSENKRVELINYTYQWPKIVRICMCVWVHVKATANKTINNKV